MKNWTKEQIRAEYLKRGEEMLDKYAKGGQPRRECHPVSMPYQVAKALTTMGWKWRPCVWSFDY